MKREAAFQKLHRICSFLDDHTFTDFAITPIKLYLFGSVLTDKPNPNDIDLLLQYEIIPGEEGYFINTIVNDRELPIHAAFKKIKQKMRNIHFEPMEKNETIVSWLKDHGMHPNTQIELIWKANYAWRSALERIKSEPQKWNPELEKLNKIFQIRYKELSDQERVEEAQQLLQKHIEDLNDLAKHE